MAGNLNMAHLLKTDKQSTKLIADLVAQMPIADLERSGELLWAEALARQGDDPPFEYLKAGAS